MTSETKFIAAAFGGTILLIAVLVFLISSKQKTQSAISYSPITGIEVQPPSYDLGNVAYSGGVVSREYRIKNSTGKDLKLLKIVTSCMCTTASVTIDGKQSKFYGMEMNGIANPYVNLTLTDGQEAKVDVKFDPASHGLAGLGRVSRSVELFFDGGVKELVFVGNVIN